jgi:hypothetical protein
VGKQLGFHEAARSVLERTLVFVQLEVHVGLSE